MFKSLLASAALMAFAGPAMATDITLCAGAPGRNYDSVMQSVAIQLNKRGHHAIVKNLGGSEDILRELDAGTCDYGPAQKDVHYKLSKESATFASTVSPLVLMYNEAMQMFCSEDSGIDELEEIDETTTVIIDSIGSGSALSWQTMKDVENEYGNKSSWINAKTIYEPLDEAGAIIALGEADCAFGVGAVPAAGWGSELNEGGLTPVYIYDKDLNDLIVGKSPLYQSVRIPQGSYSSKFDTYPIPAIVFKSEKGHGTKEIDKFIRTFTPSVSTKYNTVGKVQ